MASDRCYLQRFVFSDNSTENKLIWESDIVSNNTQKFPAKTVNGVVEIGVPYYDETPKSNGPIIIGKMSSGEVRADRVKRSKEHFKKEVWGTIPKSEQKLFRDRKDLKS